VHNGDDLTLLQKHGKFLIRDAFSSNALQEVVGY